MRAVIAFVLLYVGIFVVGALLLLLDAHRVDLELSPFDALAASATTLGNVGPAFGFAGPFGSFEPFSDVSTGIMTGLMWIGRLEIVPVDRAAHEGVLASLTGWLRAHGIRRS